MRLVSWEDPFNGTDNRCIALVDSDRSFYVALNFRCRDDEQDRIWYSDSIPEGAIEITATIDEAKRFIEALAEELAIANRPVTKEEIRQAAEENAEQYEALFKKAVKPAFVEGALWALNQWP
jgi:hypothetical protein